MNGTQAITACALIWQDFDGVKKAFVPKRADTKKFLPGVYNLPGGHVEYGEDIVEALKREYVEEFGMRISVGDPFAAFTYMNDSKATHSAEVIYFARFVDGVENMKMDPDDHSTYKWVSLEEVALLEPITPEEKAILKKGLEILNGHAHNFG